ncbi:MAG: HAD hydrolase family protein [Candidatus Lokiarchaeota archaeon]|nr:HAD hydrolase family protein [Candidatus Lokiarchaeota archaeon]
MTQKRVTCWDLEGPITILDFAADIGRLLNKKKDLGLEKFDMAEFFFMISLYDDYLIDTPGLKQKLGISDYQPGDTLRIMAPLYMASFSNNELINLAKQNLGILSGIRELFQNLKKKWEIFVISTSYTQFAYQVTQELNIKNENVYCTNFPINKLKNSFSNIKEDIDILVKKIFRKYLDNHKELETVIDDLNTFFWQDKISDYVRIMNNIKVRGGKRKELAVEEISNRTRVPISEMIAIGDSITDINMLERLNHEGGIAISFNGNKFSLKYANIALTSNNGLGILPIFENYDKIENFLTQWELKFNSFRNNLHFIPGDLISIDLKEKFLKYNFIPRIYNLNNKTDQEIKNIIEEQEKMRKIVRGWSGKLG